MNQREWILLDPLDNVNVRTREVNYQIQDHTAKEGTKTSSFLADLVELTPVSSCVSRARDNVLPIRIFGWSEHFLPTVPTNQGVESSGTPKGLRCSRVGATSSEGYWKVKLISSRDSWPCLSKKTRCVGKLTVQTVVLGHFSSLPSPPGIAWTWEFPLALRIS